MSTLRTITATTSAALLLLVSARDAAAQVNIERLRKRLDHDGVAGSLEASVVGRTGNSDGIVGSGTGQLRGQYGDSAGLLVLRGDYNRDNEVVGVKNAFAHLRYNYRILPKLWGEAFAQVQGDAIQRLRLRTLLGVGPRYAVYESEAFDLYLGTAYMFEREVLNVEPGAPDDPVTVAHRSSNYLSVTVQLDTRFLFTSVTYLQPRFDKPSDFRILSESALHIEITNVVGAKIEATVRQDSRPPTGVKPTDFTLRNALTLTF